MALKYHFIVITKGISIQKIEIILNISWHALNINTKKQKNRKIEQRAKGKPPI
jgi:hypothetical protein